MKKRSVLSTVLAVGLVLAGCASESPVTPVTVAPITVERTVEVERTVTEIEQQAPTAEASAEVVEPSAIPVSEAVAEPESAEVPVAAVATMPNVVCMDLQAAQNEIQAAGVFFSRSEDASGEGRMQINDSNWIVVDQSPGAGEMIGEGEAVLSVVKDDEPSGC